MAANGGRRKRTRENRRCAPPKEASESVVCRLCGESLRSVNHSHLRAVHGFRGRHPIEDYKRRFGLRVACSEMTCELLSEAVIKQVRRDPHKQRWTRRKLLAELRQRSRRGEMLRYSQVPGSLQGAARRLYPTWNAALESAGLDPDEHRVLWRWDRARVLDAIREACAGGASDALVGMRYKDDALLGAAVREFGSWPEAVHAAGCDEYRIPASRRKWDLETARQWVLTRRRAGRPFTADHVPGGLYDRVRQDTGNGWGAFVESLGIPYPRPVRWRTWTAEHVLSALRHRARWKRPLGAGVVRVEDGSLYYHARKHFGSWREALDRAGLH